MATKEMILKLIMVLAPKHHMDPALIASIVDVESQFRSDATGAIGERGLMQLHPRYWQGDSYYDPAINLEAGIVELANLRRHCHFELEFAFVICYNQGISGALRVHSPDQNSYYHRVLELYPIYVEYFQKAQAAPGYVQLYAQRSKVASSQSRSPFKGRSSPLPLRTASARILRRTLQLEVRNP